MTELLEAVKFSKIEIGDQPCPFCNNDNKDTTAGKIEYINDSTTLRRKMNSGGKPQPKWIMELPIHIRDYHLYTLYFDGNEQDSAEISPNGHHIIPGNESLKKVPTLLKWMATNISIKKHIATHEGMPEGTKVGSHYNKLKNDGSIKYTQGTTKNSDSAIESTTFERAKNGKIKEIFNTAAPYTRNNAKITGRIKWELNSVQNGIWLPSNNAVADWTEHPEIQKKFAEMAMDSAGCSFHDRHEDYSLNVKDYLIEVGKAIKNKHNICYSETGCETDQNEKKPAPELITKALHKLAGCIGDELEAEKFTQWYTSNHAINYKRKPAKFR